MPNFIAMRLDKTEHEVSALHRLPRAGHAFPFDFVFTFAESRRVHQSQRNSAKIDHLLDHIAGCARSRADDRAFRPEQAIEQRRFAHARKTGQHADALDELRTQRFNSFTRLRAGQNHFDAQRVIGLEGHFTRPPIIRQTWNHPYLPPLCERAGLEKAMDVFFWHLSIADRAEMLPILPQLAQTAREEHGMRIRKMSRRSLRGDLDVFGELYNEAWKDNWGFVPYGKEDLDAYALDMQLVFDRDWFMVAETPQGEPVGVAITIPDVNQVLARMGGRLLPLGWWRYLRKGRVDQCRVGFLGVRPEYQHTGVAALLYLEHFDMAEINLINKGEMGWILETNIGMNRGMQAMHGRIVKRYRMYERRFFDHVAPAWPEGARVWDPDH